MRVASPAFTLVQLLATIAIIAILAALLIPVTTAVREQAELTTCTSNLRQIGVAGLLFSSEHSGLLPTSRLYNTSDDPNEPGLVDYFDDNKQHPAFRCPALSDYDVAQTYTFNLAATSVYLGPTVWLPLVYRMNAEYPDETAWVMDGCWVEGSGWFSSKMFPTDAELQNLLYPHDNQQNVLFLDGHVELVAREALSDRRARIWTGRE